jgi:hypothetical protein
MHVTFAIRVADMALELDRFTGKGAFHAIPHGFETRLAQGLRYLLPLEIPCRPLEPFAVSAIRETLPVVAIDIDH